MASKQGKVSLDQLERVIEGAWARDTSFYPDRWSKSNPAYAHCAATALVVNDFLGGSIMRVTATGAQTESHYFNELPNGRIVDFTRRQFHKGTKFSKPERRERDYVLSNPVTAATYKIFRKRVISKLGVHDESPS